MSRLVESWVVVVAVVGIGLCRVSADDGTGARSTDAVARQRAEEFEEIGKKKRSVDGQQRQLEILKGLEFAPCRTAQRFLLRLLASRRTEGDHRLYALRALLRMADEKSLAKVIKSLRKAKDPTLWQVFGDELLVRPSTAIREWATGAALKSRDPELLCAFLRARTRKPDAALAERIEALYEEHSKSGSVDVAYQALKALVRLDPKKSGERLCAAAGHGDWRLRMAAADALPFVEPFKGTTEAAVRKLLQDESPRVQRAAIAAVGKAKRMTLAELLVAKLSDPVVRTRHAAALALYAISGKHLGHDANAWAKWLAKQDPGKPVDVASPSYHGIEIHSDHVVFVVDASSSMKWPWRKERHRIDIALAELKRTLGKLSPRTTFDVMVFAEKQDAWKKGGKPATPENTGAAAKWATKAVAEPAGDTFLYEAIQAALEEHPGCDTIFLLTDGNPTAGEFWTATGLIASVRTWTRYDRTVINTVGLSLLNMDRGMPNLSEKPALMKAVMSGIASATSGTYREILNEPK